MKESALLAVIAAVAIVATSGIVIGTNLQANSSAFQPRSDQPGYDGGMMGGWHMGNGMMGGWDQYGDADDYGCPMHSGSSWGYNSTAGMPCWGTNYTWNSTYSGANCWDQQYCWSDTLDQDPTDLPQYCQNYTACPGTSYGMQGCWNYSAPADTTPTAPAEDEAYGSHCH